MTSTGSFSSRLAAFNPPNPAPTITTCGRSAMVHIYHRPPAIRAGRPPATVAPVATGETAAMVPTEPALAAVTDRLVAAGCVAAPDEAAELVAAAPDAAALDAMVGRREQGEPLPWI